MGHYDEFYEERAKEEMLKAKKEDAELRALIEQVLTKLGNSMVDVVLFQDAMSAQTYTSNKIAICKRFLT